MLVEAQELATAEGHFFTTHGFLFKPPEGPCVIRLELKTYRWDAWLYASHTGDESVLKLPDKKRAELRDKTSQELGASNDSLVLRFVPMDQAPADLLGIPLPVLLAGLSGADSGE